MHDLPASCQSKFDLSNDDQLDQQLFLSFAGRVPAEDSGLNMKIEELREMSDEQLQATANEAAETLFRLRFQSQSERLNTPSEITKNRRLIARVKTLQTQRVKAASDKEAAK